MNPPLSESGFFGLWQICGENDSQLASLFERDQQFRIALQDQIGHIDQNGYFRMCAMKSMSAKDAKNGFGRLLDTARAEPVTVEKHGRPVVVVISVEEFERLTAAKKNTAEAQPAN
ncbi:MAG: type II toxin-antitoxin system Phd/YefM family antitoxin [Rhodospirillales bacterium]|nr:type II toxin-antitoxin system Phd/YefM family antitoxin [Rhodospirillales bacterium]